MIVGKLGNSSTYWQWIADRLPVVKALRWLEKLENVSLGKFPIESYSLEEMHALVSKNPTKPLSHGVYESHRRYYDIHFVVNGASEQIHVTPTNLLRPSTDYDKEKDVTLYEYRPATSIETLGNGLFIICAPGDAHIPGVTIGTKSRENIKVVIKIHQKLFPKSSLAHRR